MTPDEGLARIETAAGWAGWQPTRVDLGAGAPVVVARTSEFRWRWIATRLHTFLVATTVPPGAGRAVLDGFVGAATRLAKDSKGGLPRGLQTGVAVLTVAVTAGAPPDMIGWASQVHGRQFAAIPWPVLVDTVQQTIAQPERMVIGGVYKAYLQDQVARLVSTPLAP